MVGHGKEHLFYTYGMTSPTPMRLEAGANDAHLDHGRCNGREAQTDQGQSGGVEDSGNPREALARVLDDVRQRWGASSLVYLEARKPDAGTSVASPNLLRPTPGTGDTADARSALPAWWPGATTRDGRALTVPPVLEVSGQVGGGRLTFALAWAGALRPTLLALVDIPGDHGGRIFPPSLQVAGLSLPTQVIVVRPPPGPTPRETTRAVLDALFIMLRSEAFDAIVCPLPEGARVGLAAASTIASLTARTGTALLVLAGPGRAHGRTSSRTGDFTARTGVLGPAASYRLVLEDHHWEWRDGEIGGLTLRVQTLRARGAPSATNAPDLARPSGGDARVDQGRGGGVGAEDPLAVHTLAFRLHRPARDGALPGGGGGIASGAWILQSAMPATDLPGRVRATPPVTGNPGRVAVG